MIIPSTYTGIKTISDFQANSKYPVMSIQVDPTSRFIAVGCHSKTIRIFDSCKKHFTGPIKKMVGCENESISSLSWIDSTRLISANLKGKVSTWDGECSQREAFKSHYSPHSSDYTVTTDCAARTDSRCLVAFNSGIIPIWSATTAKVEIYLKSSKGLGCAKFDPTNESLVVVGENNGEISLFDIREDRFKVTQTSVKSPGKVIDVKFPNANERITLSTEGVVELWDSRQAGLILTYETTPSKAAAAIEVHENLILCGSSKRRVSLYNKNSSQAIWSKSLLITSPDEPFDEQISVSALARLDSDVFIAGTSCGEITAQRLISDLYQDAFC